MKNNDKALKWAEHYGIVEYTVNGNTMVYYKSYQSYGGEPRTTYKHSIDLSTGKETITKLKRWNPIGLYNV